MFWRRSRRSPTLYDSPGWKPSSDGEDGAKWAFLAEHPWIGPSGRSHRDGRPGRKWVICADLVAEDHWDEHAWAQRWEGMTGDSVALMDLESAKQLWLCGPVAAFSYQGRSLQPEEVTGLYWYGRRLLLLPAGSIATFLQWSGYRDEQSGQFRDNARFELADGRTFTLPAFCQRIGDPYGLTLSWREVACAALIVPAGHRLAADRAAAEELADQIAKQTRANLDSRETLEVTRVRTGP